MDKKFHGAKAAVYIGEHLLVYQRDSHVPWPGLWDFPGGGREGDETPKACLQREIMEEFGLKVQDADITWGKAVPSMVDPSMQAWFFVVHLPETARHDVHFGQEGQRWALMSPQDVLNLQNMVPELQNRFMLWLRKGKADHI